VTIQSVQRVCVRLDPAMLLERLLLSHLSLIPKARRQEWLRGLLVSGYLAEQRTERAASGLDTRESSEATPGSGRETTSWNAFARWTDRRRSSGRAPAVPAESEFIPAVPQASKDCAEGPTRVGSTRDKPFSHLRRVIG
jgi:hypothetical protein